MYLQKENLKYPVLRGSFALKCHLIPIHVFKHIK